MLATTDNLAGSAPTPDTRHATPAEPNWPLLYTVVLAELVTLIVAFYAFTKAFA
ncbi:MAG TPA: hypothetical protein VHX14_03090 [Thermoanaerobaculia bacterium]|nr:hypothetical protein [Thermoanaerobaculia bacterium]